MSEDMRLKDEKSHSQFPEAKDMGIVDAEDPMAAKAKDEIFRPELENLDSPTLTLRVFLVSIVFTFLLSYANQIGNYRTQALSVDVTIAYILAYPILRFLAACVPSRKWRIFGYTIDTNPGPFTIREHIFLAVVTNEAGGNAYVGNLLYYMEAELGINLGWGGDFMIILITKMAGYGIAMFMCSVLISPKVMIWPGAQYTAEVFRMMHDGGISRRLKMFAIFGLVFGVYTLLPDLFMPTLASVSILCLAAGGNRNVNILGNGQNYGMGLTAINFDVSQVWPYWSSLAYIPTYAAVNILLSGMFLYWVIVPLFYFTDTYHAKNFPAWATSTFTSNGTTYPMSDLTSDHGTVYHPEVYEAAGPVYLSTGFSLTYMTGFMSLPAIITYVILKHRHTVMDFLTKKEVRDISEDAEYMNSTFKEIPKWLGAVIYIGFGVWAIAFMYIYDLNTPWWAIVVALALSAFFTLPIGIVQGLTGQQIGLNIVSELVGGFMLPHNSVGVVFVKIFGYMPMYHALGLMANLKVGQILRVPYRELLFMQMWGTLLTSLADTAAYRQVMDNNLLDGTHEAWQSINIKVFVTAVNLWGAVGPWNAFIGPNSPYYIMAWSSIALGVALPIIFHLLGKKWSMFNFFIVPLWGIFAAFPNQTAWLASACVIVILFHSVLPRVAPEFSKKYVFVTVAGISFGVGMVGFIIQMLAGFANAKYEASGW
eukprot:Nk52_evm1s1359 gene=Nk52_evmTU1s1359